CDSARRWRGGRRCRRPIDSRRQSTCLERCGRGIPGGRTGSPGPHRPGGFCLGPRLARLGLGRCLDHRRAAPASATLEAAMSLCIAGARGLISLAAALMLCAGAGAAEPWDPGRIESLAGWRWAAPLAFDLPGGRMLVRRFRAPVAPVDAARRLAHAGRARFGQLQFSGAGLLLSGVQDGRHWLAQLQPAEAGSGETTGLLSSLEPGRRIDAGFDPVALVPPDARPVLRASSRMGRAAGLLASYLCPGPYRRVDAAVRDALQGRPGGKPGALPPDRCRFRSGGTRATRRTPRAARFQPHGPRGLTPGQLPVPGPISTCRRGCPGRPAGPALAAGCNAGYCSGGGRPRPGTIGSRRMGAARRRAPDGSSASPGRCRRPDVLASSQGVFMTLPSLRIPRSAILGALALGTGLLAAGALALHVRERERQIEARARLDMVERIVAARDLAAGTRLAPDDLAVRSFPARWVGS